MLVEMAVADAYGIAFEFVDDTRDRPNDLSRYYQHPRYADMVPGHYTDDTQRSIANALVVLDGNPFDAMSYIRAYVEVYAMDPRPGYSRRYEAFLKQVLDHSLNPDERAIFFRRNIQRNASSNGAIMGAAVLGYIRDPHDCALAAGIQAMTTHGAETVPYAQAVALLANWFIYAADREPFLSGGDDPNVDIDDFIARHVSIGDMPLWRTGPDVRTDMSAKQTWKAVRRAINSQRTLADILSYSVKLGGDTDSVAAIAVGIASCTPFRQRNLPVNLVETLENGPFGRYYLQHLDTRLAEYRMGAKINVA